MDKESIERVRKSYLRVISAQEFGESFYKHFMQSSPEIAEKLNGTSSIKQRIMVSEGLKLLIDFAETGEPSERFKEIVEKHDRHHLDIRPDLYNHYRHHILSQLAVSDPEFDMALKEVWEQVLDIGIAHIVEAY